MSISILGMLLVVGDTLSYITELKLLTWSLPLWVRLRNGLLIHLLLQLLGPVLLLLPVGKDGLLLLQTRDSHP